VANPFPLAEHFDFLLLGKGGLGLPELEGQGVLVQLLDESLAQGVRNSEAEAGD